MNVVFLQVGDDPRAQVMVNSVRAQNPSYRIIQCSDPDTNSLIGVDEVFHQPGDISNLMTFRLQMFAAVKLDEPSVYVDTDMIFIKPIEESLIFNSQRLALCRRVFLNDKPINASFNGMDLHEYKGKAIGKIYPYLACFTAVSDSSFWSACLEKLQSLDKKFHFWYGDQEALRELARSGLYPYAELSEAVYACLPENFLEHQDAKVLHFKGPSRKSLMFDVGRELGLVDS
jgi:hypothetical protein